jgi:hypothetical protein
MAQGKGIVIVLSILPIKVISWEITGFFRIDVILLRGVVEHLLESSIVATLLKFLILVRDLSKILSEHCLSTDSFWISKESAEWLPNHCQILRVFAFLGNTESTHFFLFYWELLVSLKTECLWVTTEVWKNTEWMFIYWRLSNSVPVTPLAVRLPPGAVWPQALPTVENLSWK